MSDCSKFSKTVESLVKSGKLIIHSEDMDKCMTDLIQITERKIEDIQTKVQHERHDKGHTKDMVNMIQLQGALAMMKNLEPYYKLTPKDEKSKR